MKTNLLMQYCFIQVLQRSRGKITPPKKHNSDDLGFENMQKTEKSFSLSKSRQCFVSTRMNKQKLTLWPEDYTILRMLV